MPKPTRNAGRLWTAADVQALERLAAGNTPTPVISFKLGRTPGAVQAKAAAEDISLKLVNKSPYTRR
jgi:hypothetical protein